MTMFNLTFVHDAFHANNTKQSPHRNQSTLKTVIKLCALRIYLYSGSPAGTAA